MGGIKGGMVEGVKRDKKKGRGRIKLNIDRKSEKWNIGQRSEMGGIKGGMVEGVKRAERKRRGEIERKID